jgi:hypothetical protein
MRAVFALANPVPFLFRCQEFTTTSSRTACWMATRVEIGSSDISNSICLSGSSDSMAYRVHNFTREAPFTTTRSASVDLDVGGEQLILDAQLKFGPTGRP